MEILNEYKGSIVKIKVKNGASYIGIVDFYSKEQTVLHMRRVGLTKSDVTWYNEATISEEVIEEIDDPTDYEMTKYLKSDRDLIKNGSVH
ncbi:hypothetical protein EVB81_059 [Rhizobium phage RHph_I46]|uniref:Uncharacterized protein n=1 Tax=Rhizobium phage RHph_I1_9 TaxID=2509729 RepID=A0A7S5RES8_9CAUD|nr:hypothetical protein PP936_gp058 [Rhizobium phage RHph_I1_9]QIG69628.1 hypothetical protein EVB81_059 [Rhizobium phage RHph_I46]QIG70909.1 hypothetical protein EVB92_059 [Rhizobium phage RHph_I9]QIG73495.1 hypothetical protein EVC04_058 [Rhizobium phage RHph_I1_9]QIG76248.1 hypothetical protein EVC25_059 [Rhizobium phage RHph_I34]